MDLKALGFKCGIEIHQRIDTPTKLFCTCSAEFSENPSSGTLHRRIRAVAGELGKVDAAAAFEAARGRVFQYHLYDRQSCLIDNDEEPPHAISHEALDIGLTISLLLQSNILDEVHVMRKTISDGSAVSGFQRSALLSTGGKLDTPKGIVGIQSVAVEEEACGIVEKGGEVGVFRLDRLGIPLIEIATDPHIQDGQHAREVAETIGMLLRGTGRVQRGIGTIRQDLNVSIAGGAKVEIKGAQELDEIAALVENEAKRQHVLLEIKEELHKRSSGLHGVEIKDLTEPLRDTNVTLLAKGLAAQASILGIRLAGFAGLVGRELMPNHRLGTEFSDYAKVRAGVKGLIHSDENLSKYGFTQGEVHSIQKGLDVNAQDAWILIVDREDKARRALEAVIDRAHKCFTGVPPETRRPEGERSVFLRPIPGSARMYPETDAVPIRVTTGHLEKLSANMPPSMQERKKRYLGLGLNEEMASLLLRRGDFLLFERLLQSGAEPVLLAATLTETFRAFRRAGLPVELITEGALQETFAQYAQGALTRAGVQALLEALAKEPATNPNTIITRLDLQRRTGAKLRELIEGYGGTSGLFERVMREHRLRVDATELKNMLDQLSIGK